MLKISTKSQYGLRAMAYLAKCRDKICPLKIISGKEGISFDYLEKIISKLEKTGLIKAKKGVQGGYFLAKSPKRIKIGEIIRALEGDTVLVKCIAPIRKRGYRCPRERKCLTKNFWQKIQKTLNSALNSITLADLITPKDRAHKTLCASAYGARKPR
jgi:Rrf2 family protein